MKDCITITQLKVYAYHGVLEAEKENGQDFYLDMKLFLDLKTPGKTDCLDDSLNYAEVCHFVTDEFTKKKYDLIESACENLIEALLLRYPLLQKAEVTLYKPHAPIGLPFGNVSISMSREWHKVYLSFGSNMGEKDIYIRDGIDTIQNSTWIRNVKVSELIETEPYGYVEQDSFLNGCLYLETIFSPEELLAFLHDVEAKANRKRIIRWGPRTLDLDILFYDKLVWESEDLIIPHIDLENRSFVLEPLLQLCPNFRHPVSGLTVRQLAANLKNKKEE